MQLVRPVGPGASAQKYDLLTALGAYALAMGKAEQRTILRLMTLVTARYNWGRDELTVGQREIASLWHCDERTVKREMAKLRALGWLVVRRQGARGRVTDYRLDIARMLEATRERWTAVGPDFAQRLEGAEPDTNVVPLQLRTAVAAPDPGDGSEWALAQAILHGEDQASFTSWFRHLKRGLREGRRLYLQAPSRFHADYIRTHLSARLLAACRAVDGNLDEIVVLA